jgi:hypothetical protein
MGFIHCKTRKKGKPPVNDLNAFKIPQVPLNSVKTTIIYNGTIGPLPREYSRSVTTRIQSINKGKAIPLQA